MSKQFSLRGFVEHPLFDRVILALIGLNAITLGLETSQIAMDKAGSLLIVLDKVLLGIFCVEVALKLAVYRLDYWRDGWRVFDFAVVAVALVPSAGPLSVLRAFRVLRILRLISIVPAMRNVVTGLFAAMPGIGSIGLLLGIVYYVFAVMATKLFGASFPEWFGTIGASVYSLFQIMTLESWSMGIVRPVMETYPFAWAFFVPFILMTTFTVLNLFIGVMVEAMQRTTEASASDERKAVLEETDMVLDEVRAMRAEITELRRLAQSQQE